MYLHQKYNYGHYVWKIELLFLFRNETMNDLLCFLEIDICKI